MGADSTRFERRIAIVQILNEHEELDLNEICNCLKTDHCHAANPRTVQRADGRLVTIYYFNDRSQKERYIAATIWSPGSR